MAKTGTSLSSRARRASRRILAIVLLALVPLLHNSVNQVQAQDGNLLRNPSFEGTYHAWSGIPEIQVADEWTPWWLPQQDSDPPEINRRPEYKRADAALFANRVHSGSAAQQWFTFHSTHVAGMYQQVSGILPGKRLQFSVWAQAWSSSEDDPYVSIAPGVINLQVGIDPTGNTDPWAGTVAWSGTVNVYDQWVSVSMEAVAQSSAVTVFLKSAPQYPVKHNDTYWDDAALIVVGDAPPPPSPTPESSPTVAEPTPTASPTDEPPTATPAPTATCSPPPADWVPYIVQSGDYLTALSEEYNISVTDIVAANCLDRTDLYTGETIFLPPLPPTATPPPATATATESPTPEPPAATATRVPSATPVQVAAATLTGTPTPRPTFTSAATELPAEPTQPAETRATATPDAGGGPLDNVCGTTLAPGILLIGLLLHTRQKRLPDRPRQPSRPEG